MIKSNNIVNVSMSQLTHIVQLLQIKVIRIKSIQKIMFSYICISYADFDAITDPIMKAKMVALKGINKVMVQNNMGMTQMVMNK